MLCRDTNLDLRTYAGTNEPINMAHAYIGFGSNIDDRLNYITQALRLLLEADSVSLIQISSLYETEPVGYEEQDWFLNGVVAVETDLSVHQLLTLLKEIEGLVGRQHRARWRPREVRSGSTYLRPVLRQYAGSHCATPRNAPTQFCPCPVRGDRPQCPPPDLSTRYPSSAIQLR